MSYIERTSVTFKQILASDTGHDSLSGVLAQDVGATTDIAAGTILGIVTATGKFAEYNAGNSDGTEDAVGILKTPITKETRIAGDIDVAVYYRGAFQEDKLVGLDAGALTDLKGRTLKGITVF